MGTTVPPRSMARTTGSRHAPAGFGEVLTYWHGLRRGRPVPARADIDPTAIQRHLGHCAIIERGPTGKIKFRVAGKAFGDILGMDPRGMPVRALFNMGSRDRLAALLAAVFTGPETLTMTMGAGAEKDVQQMRGMIALPLSDTSGDVTRALIMISLDALNGTTPQRFWIHDARLTPVVDGNSRPSDRTRFRLTCGERPVLRVIEGGRG